jgi:hypothetical protein
VSVAGDGSSASFDPDTDLAHETLYTVPATAGITDGAGNPLVPFEASFTTEEPDTTRPFVDGVVPTETALDVAVAADVTVSFSEPVDPATVTTGTFTVSNGGPVAGVVSVAGDGLSATFAPDGELAYQTGYSVALTDGVLDPADNPMVPFASTFTTADPAPEPGVPVFESVRVDDGPSHDGTGNDSKGNNDGVAQCGETIELYITAMNAGDLGLSGLSGALLESDPYVTLLYNTSSSYPNLASGASGENPRDWDLRVSSSTPNGHDFEFSIRYNASEGGPWDVDVTVPIGCGGGDPDPDPGDPGVPVLVSVRVDDGPSHDGTGNDSNGNNDGFAQCGETIELYVTIRNDGELTLTSLSGLLSESDGFVTLLYNSSSSYANLAAGATGENPRDWDLRISPDTPHGHQLSFTVTYTASGDASWPIDITIPIGCGGPPVGDPGVPVFVSVRVDDGPSHDGTGNDSKGNNDGLAQCGETIELYVTVRNDGELALTGLAGVLTEADPHVALLYNTSSSYPDLGGGGEAENPRDWDLRISPDAPDGYQFEFTVIYTASGGASWPIDATVPIGCP